MKIFSSKNLIYLILIISFLLRVLFLEKYPSGFHIDEAQIGYNAFSILKTLRDENGNFLPLHTSFFNESRPMLTIYLTVPWVYLFGLNIFATRLTNALLGVLAVLLSYLIVKKLFQNTNIAIISSALLAVSPWHIILSRSSADGAIGLTFLLVSILFLIKWIESMKTQDLVLTYFSFILTYFSYTGVRPLIYIVVIFWLIYFTIKKNRKKLSLLLLIILVFTFFPVYLTSINGDAFARYQQIGNIGLKEAESRLQSSFLEDAEQGSVLLFTRIFHNKIENNIREFLGEYFKYLNFDFLFIHGGYPIRFTINEQPLQYWVEIPMLLVGIYLLLQKNNIKKTFVLYMFIVGAIPASLTTEDSPNFQRAIYMLPAFQIIVGLGIYSSLKYLKKNLDLKNITITSIIISTFFFWEISRFLHQFTIHQPLHQPWHRNIEFREIAVFISQNALKYDKIIHSKLGTEPYLFLLFYQKIDPTIAQNLVKNRNTEGNWNFGNIIFDKNPCSLQELTEIEENVLYGNKGECTNIVGSKVIKEIRRPDNTIAIKYLVKD